MGNTVTTYPKRRENNPDDRIGQEIRISDACVSYGGGGDVPARGLVPDNGEYQFSSIQGNCNACTTCQPNMMQNPSGCDDKGNCGVPGGYPYYKRVSYNAPVYDCCTQGIRTIGPQTCDPEISGGNRINAPQCQSSISTHCSNANYLFNHQVCKDWCGANDKNCRTIYNDNCSAEMIRDGNNQCVNWCESNRDLCDTKIRDFCKGSNIDSQFCKDKLIEYGGADSAVNAWCIDHIDDPFCACNKLLKQANEQTDDKTDPTIKAVLARPECYNSTCSSGSSYKNTNIRNAGACPSVNACVNQLISASNQNTSVSNIVQKCDQAITSTVQQKTVSATAPENNTTSKLIDDTEESEWFDNNIFIIFIVFIIFVLMGVSAAVYYKQSDKKIFHKEI